MRATNILNRDPYWIKHDLSYRTSDEPPEIVEQKQIKPKKGRKKGFYMNKMFHSEEKNLTLANLMEKECQKLGKVLLESDEFRMSAPIKSKNNSIIPKLRSNHYELMDEDLNYKSEDVDRKEPLYMWVHLSCVNYMAEPSYTARGPIKLGHMNAERTEHSCLICEKQVGFPIKCSQSDCEIWFHGECARRAGFYMEEERIREVDENGNYMIRQIIYGTNKGERNKSIFCEKHRPFKLMKEIEEKNSILIEDVIGFAKDLQKALELVQKMEEKKRVDRHTSKKVRRWRERDKK